MKYYRIHLSGMKPVKADEEDLQKLEANIGRGNIIRLKKAIVNPSFLVGIVPISRDEAMEGEPKREVEGYVDETSGTYKVVNEKSVITDGLVDEFKVVEKG